MGMDPWNMNQDSGPFAYTNACGALVWTRFWFPSIVLQIFGMPPTLRIAQPSLFCSQLRTTKVCWQFVKNRKTSQEARNH